MKKLTYLLVLFLLLGQTACKKEKEKSVKDYLVQGVWHGVSYKFTENGTVTAQGSYDFTLDFNDNGRYVKKNADGNVVDEGGWIFLNNDKEIHVESEAPQQETNTYLIDRLDDKRLTYHYYDFSVRKEFNFKQ